MKITKEEALALVKVLSIVRSGGTTPKVPYHVQGHFIDRLESFVIDRQYSKNEIRPAWLTEDKRESKSDVEDDFLSCHARNENATEFMVDELLDDEETQKEEPMSKFLRELEKKMENANVHFHKGIARAIASRWAGAKAGTASISKNDLSSMNDLELVRRDRKVEHDQIIDDDEFIGPVVVSFTNKDCDESAMSFLREDGEFDPMQSIEFVMRSSVSLFIVTSGKEGVDSRVYDLPDHAKKFPKDWTSTLKYNVVYTVTK